VTGWHYFCFRALDAIYETVRRGSAVRLHLGLPGALVPLARYGRRVPDGRASASGCPSALVFQPHGSIIPDPDAAVLAIILSTQFSFGRLFAAFAQMCDRSAAAIGTMRARREERRRKGGRC
jgi:hypothetical protein